MNSFIVLLNFASGIISRWIFIIFNFCQRVFALVRLPGISGGRGSEHDFIPVQIFILTNPNMSVHFRTPFTIPFRT